MTYDAKMREYNDAWLLDNYKSVTFRADIELVDTFRKLCKEKRVSQAKILKRAMVEYIKENDNG